MPNLLEKSSIDLCHFESRVTGKAFFFFLYLVLLLIERKGCIFLGKETVN